MCARSFKLNPEIKIEELPVLAEGEVTVIGAGPAGSAAAAAAAVGGVSVLILEKKEQIGLPVQCCSSSALPTPDIGLC